MCIDLEQGVGEHGEQGGLVVATLCGELAVPIAALCALPDAADEPLARVALDVQDQVADAVRSLGRSPPEIVVAEWCTGELDARQVLVEQVVARGVEKS
ncbi:MAG: hypothetical protein U5K74_13255 [Gemmatimonadaceae bacterium]|nr:hypothetical protein [Gemmatimonadaceae bacterium]